jgi:periplasmic protein TonB
MNNALSMSASEFERQKNLKASGITLGIAGTLLLLFIFVRWSLPAKEEAPPEQFVEIVLPDFPPVDDVNLGNNDVGSGNVQPIVTGTPSSEPVSQNVAPSRGANVQQATRDIETDDRSAGPPVTKPTNPNPDAREINNNTNNQTVSSPQPQLRAGARMTSTRGSGNGGNTDLPGMNRPGSQGPGDGPGDKGVQNGNPNGRRYAGVRIVAIPAQSFEDDFNEGGTIALDIVVDENGKLVSAGYQVSGSSLPKSSRQYSIALKRAREINYPKESGGFKQTLKFNFSVK